MKLVNPDKGSGIKVLQPCDKGGIKVVPLRGGGNESCECVHRLKLALEQFRDMERD